MAAVALDHGAPLVHQPPYGAGGEAVRAGHLGPDHHSQAGGPVEVARILDLLVLAHAVEAHLTDGLDVTPDHLVARRSQPGLGPVALVEDGTQVVRPRV